MPAVIAEKYKVPVHTVLPWFLAAFLTAELAPTVKNLSPATVPARLKYSIKHLEPKVSQSCRSVNKIVCNHGIRPYNHVCMYVCMYYADH